MADSTLLPDPTCLHLRLLDASTSTITAIVETTSPEAACPLCHQPSTQVHSRLVESQRQPAQLRTEILCHLLVLFAGLLHWRICRQYTCSPQQEQYPLL